MVACELPQRRAQPGFDRDGETFLRTVNDCVGQDAPHGFAQHRLFALSTELRSIWQCGGEFHQLVIQKRHTQFQPVGHGHFVGLDEEVIGEPYLGIDIQHLIQRCSVLYDPEKPTENLPQPLFRLSQPFFTDKPPHAFSPKAAGHPVVAGFERLATTWKDRNAMRFAEAMRCVAAELVRAARDAEEVGSAPVGLRHLVSGADRDAAQRAREAARTALLERLRTGEAGVLAELVQLHRTGAPLAPMAGTRADEGFSEHQPVDSPQAGMAGAATGAAVGAGFDLLTGGLTLGAATALGALIGGGAAYSAAAWRNRGSASGQPQVQLGDELLQEFTESLVLAYLAVAHRALPAGASPHGWRAEVVAAVEARREELAALWRQARAAPQPAAAIGPLARALEDLVRRLLERL